MLGEWIKKPQGESCVVFIHGILSSGETCWRNSNGTFWPELLNGESQFNSLGIYVFTYETDIFSGSYRLSDIVDALKEFMRLDGVLDHNQIIFVCHSMGGLVARKFIVEQAIKMLKKELLLFLLASPSLGSTYANWLSPLAKLLGHSQADALLFVRNNDWLADLGKEFLNLKESGEPKIRGKELVEDKFIILKSFFGRQVVEPFSGARYFGEPFKVPTSDHFSIAKPKDKNAIQHRLLCRFILDNAPSPAADEKQPSPVTKPPLGLTMTSIYAIDEQGFDSAMERFGPNWPECKIEWPKASDRLLTIIQDALRRFDEEGAGLIGSEYFIKNAPRAIADAIRGRSLVQKQLPNLIRRSSEFGREYLKVAVKNYLLLANWQTHQMLIYLSSWQGLKQLGLEVPASVIPFQGISFEDTLSRLFDETSSEIYTGRLNYSVIMRSTTSTGATSIYMEGSTI
jgi:Alpha/beta hydrolase family